MTTAIGVVIGVLVLAAAITVLRAVRPGSLGDRAVALDTLSSVITIGLVAGAAMSGDGLLLDIALLLGLLGFLTSVTVGRFIERRGE